MSSAVPSTVLFHRLEDDGGLVFDPARLTAPVRNLTARLEPAAVAAERWGIKVQLGPAGRPATVDPVWAAAVTDGLSLTAAGISCFACDTLSINQEGLHTVAALEKTAAAKGYDPDRGGLPFQVADDPDRGRTLVLGAPGGGEPVSPRLASAAAGADGMVLMNSPLPHPHLGFQAAVAGLGLGLSDRQGKLELHRDIRPKVDTPLCAGCGSCLAACLFDAIDLRSGRAFISAEKCTGCGECMTVCHMAGISAEDAAAIPLFQRKVAAAGAAFSSSSSWGRSGKAVFISFLVHLDHRYNRSAVLHSGRQRHLGILAAADPVALDQAAWDLLAANAGGRLADWCGYAQDPGPLLAESEKLGLGTVRYRLVEVI